jgi:hypothetical protein
MEIVNESIENKDERICLHFSPEARQRWIAFYNQVETEMRLLGFFQTLKIMHLKSLKIWQGLLHYYTILMVMKGMYHLPLLKLL